MIEKLVATLEQKVKDLTPEEIADILWLTLQQWQSELSPEANKRSVKSSLESPTVEPLLSDNTLPIPPPSGEVVSSSGEQRNEDAGITTRPPQKKSETETASDLGAPLAIPDSPSLRRSLDILRAIRPLIRLVPSAEATYLDVPATVKAIAETDLWLLKLRPVLEPWLELALVVDATPSMVIWQRTILNLRRVLAQSGVFRDVRLWSLETQDCMEEISESTVQKISPKLCVRSGFGTATASQPPRRPQELLDPNGRRLILVVSDCIDPRWDAQPIRDLLQVLARQSPIGLVQVLPEWLWSRTALSQVTKGQMVGLRPGQPSQSLTFVSRNRWLSTTPVGVKLPVMTLEPAVTNRWSQMVAGKSSFSSPGLVFSPVSVRELSYDAEFDSQESEEPTPQERLAQFRNFSSVLARRLAGLLAACPEVNLPVVRMVQAALLPDSQQVHVAEVLLGGLFKSQTEITAYTPADRIQYVFHDGVKPLVQETISPKQSFKALSAWVKRRFGYALEDFPAYLTEAQNEEIKPFAGVMLDVLNRQSSRYADLIERVEALSGTRTSVEIDSTKKELDWSDFPALETLNFYAAQLVEAGTEIWPPPLQIEEYTVATIAIETTALSELLPHEPDALSVLEFIERRYAGGHDTSEEDVARLFNKPKGDDGTYYLLENLRLLGYLEITKIGEGVGTVRYNLAPLYLETRLPHPLSPPQGEEFASRQEQLFKTQKELLESIIERSEQQQNTTPADTRSLFSSFTDALGRYRRLEHLRLLGFVSKVGVGSDIETSQYNLTPEYQEYRRQKRQPLLRSLSFNVVTLDHRGGVTRREKKSARYFTETLPTEIPLDMVYIPGGEFMMGSPAEEPERFDDESPQHLVKVPDFYLGRYPVTQAQWRKVAALPQEERELDLDPSRFKGDSRPVEQVSWEEAIEFCARLSRHTKRQYRLPSEAEWEYAARAGTTTPFHFGKTISTELVNYNGIAYADGPTGKSRGKTTPVDHFDIANAWGLCDMHGNVWEWCQDHWHDNYEGSPKDGSAWLTDNAEATRVLRGGSWVINPRYCRSAYRYVNNPGNRVNNIGFRVACAAPGLL